MADPIIVDTPDGGTAEFPAGTPIDVIKGALAKKYPKPPPEKSLLRQGLDAFEDQAKWQRSRAIGAAAKVADMAADMGPVGIVRKIATQVAPETTKAVTGYRPFDVLPALYPTGQDVRNFAYGQDGKPSLGLEARNTPGPLGRVIDEGVEAAIIAPMFPGGGRNIIPGFGGGGASEGAGIVTEGSKFEPLARIFAGLVGAGAGALGQAAVNKGIVQPVRNIIGREVEEPAARIVARAAQNDKVPVADLYTKPRAMGPDALPVDVGGENVRGALRGSIVSPGPARTRVGEVFDARAAGEPSRVGATIDRNVSPQGLTQTVDDLAAARSRASRQAYEAAGVPGDPAAYAQAPQLQGKAVTDLIAKSADVRRAIASARRLPDYQDLPDTSMVMLDKAYKHIGGMAEAAKRAGNGERFRDLDSLRKSLAAAIGDENTAYSQALKAYSEPSKLMDAAELGRSLFAKNARPDLVAREFKNLPADAQDAFRIGVAEHLRTVAGRRDATNVAGRVAGGPDARLRLSAVLGPKEAKAILDDLAREQVYTQTDRAVRAGSRTTPMAAEGLDNMAAAGGAVGDVARGNYGNAFMRLARVVAGRVGEGRTGRVNERVAQMLTAATPEEQTATLNALNAFLMRERVPVTRNAFMAGAGFPLLDTAIQEGRR